MGRTYNVETVLSLQDKMSGGIDRAEQKLGALEKRGASAGPSLAASMAQAAPASMMLGGAVAGLSAVAGAYVVKATLTAARTEMMGVAFKVMAKNAHISTRAADAHVKKMVELGIYGDMYKDRARELKDSEK